jgi:circadian clock protein KaiB
MADLRLELYIVGQSRNSAAALENLRRLCDAELAGRCHLQVIDLLEHPEAGDEMNIVATPTLIKSSPLPVRRLVGDLSDTRLVLDSLDMGQDSEGSEETDDDSITA